MTTFIGYCFIFVLAVYFVLLLRNEKVSAFIFEPEPPTPRNFKPNLIELYGGGSRFFAPSYASIRVQWNGGIDGDCKLWVWEKSGFSDNISRVYLSGLAAQAYKDAVTSFSWAEQSRCFGVAQTRAEKVFAYSKTVTEDECLSPYDRAIKDQS